MIQIAKDKNDPTVDSKVSQSDSGAHPARPVEEAADAGVNKQYADNPDKPAPSSVAQVEVLPEDK